jgi:prepilin-type N-terminal cleavage/methylation domain-containing protein
MSKIIKNFGFTLVELITVIGLLAIMVIYITSEFASSQDAAKISLARSFLLKSFPSAISSHLLSNGGCVFGTNTTAVGNELLNRGVAAGTPWKPGSQLAANRGDTSYTIWSAISASVSGSDSVSRKVLQVTYPLENASNPVMAGDEIVKSLTGKPGILSVLNTAGTLTINYLCS